MKRNKRCFALLLACLLFVGSCTACGKEEEADSLTTQENNAVTTVQTEQAPEENAVPTLLQNAPKADGAPQLSASAAILVEASTGTVLMEKNASEKMYPASMTKILTALVVLDYFQPEELVTVGREINEVSWDSSKAGHVVGETLTVENLIRGLIIPSGNDTANVLAAATARRASGEENMSFADCESYFADLMNEKAKELGALNTHFTNAHGYHDPEHYTTAYDMALICIEAMKNETIATIAGEKSFSGNGANNMFSETESMQTQDYTWRSHNLLITDNEYQYEYATGIKTGFTDEAGDCLAASAQKDGAELIAVLFHAEDPARWLEATALFEYGFNSYAMQTVAQANTALEEVPLHGHNRLNGDTLSVVAGTEVNAYLPTGMASGITWTVSYEEDLVYEGKEGEIMLQAPLTEHQQIGTVSFLLNGQEIMQQPVYSATAVEEGTLWTNIRYYIGAFFAQVFSLKGLIVLAVIVVIVIVILFLRKRRSRSYSAYTFRSRSRFGGYSRSRIGGRSGRRSGRRRRFK